MNGDQLLQFLQKLTPEQRKLQVVHRHWVNDEQSSGWEEELELENLRIASGSNYRLPNSNPNVIVLE